MARRNLSSLREESTPLQLSLTLLIPYAVLGQQNFSSATMVLCYSYENNLPFDQVGIMVAEHTLLGKMHSVVPREALAASREHCVMKVLSRGQMKLW